MEFAPSPSGGHESAGAIHAARFFQALADPTRIAILEALSSKERSVTDLVERLAEPQPKVSRHLRVLHEAGLVVFTREGRNVFYRLATRKLWPAPARDWVDRLAVGDESAANAPIHSPGPVPSAARDNPAAPPRRDSHPSAATDLPRPPSGRDLPVPAARDDHAPPQRRHQRSPAARGDIEPHLL